MEQQGGNVPGTDSGPNMVWIIVKIAIVILIVFLGIRFFSEKRQSGEEENGYVERKKTKPTKTRKKKDE